MKRAISFSIIAALAATTSAPAQDAFDDPAAGGEPPSELELLSQTTESPFTEIIEQRKRRPVSVKVRALDKITARYTDIEMAMNEPARFGSLEILPRFCDKRPPEEFPETSAFLEVFDRDLSRARVSGSAGAQLAAASGESAPAAEMAQAAEGEGASEAASSASTAADPDRIFSGWMFASTPALNALEHPVYDVWVIDCRTEVVEE